MGGIALLETERGSQRDSERHADARHSAPRFCELPANAGKTTRKPNNVSATR